MPEPDEQGAPADGAEPEQPAALPHFPSAPPPPMPPSPTGVAPPTEVVASFWCWIAAAVLNVVAALLRIGDRDQLMNLLRPSVRSATGGPLTDDQLRQLATVTITIAIVIAVIIAFLYGLFAFKARAGRNWARIVLSVIAVLELLSLITQTGGATVLSYVSEIIAVVAAVLLYLRGANDYFAAARRRR